MRIKPTKSPRVKNKIKKKTRKLMFDFQIFFVLFTLHQTIETDRVHMHVQANLNVSLSKKYLIPIKFIITFASFNKWLTFPCRLNL